MPRRQQIEGGTKNKILEVGRRMFFENGFDGTGIRAVMREVGLDVGAFYYYFKTKDELFDEVLADFFAPYRQDFEHIAKEAHLAPYQAMLRFFQYIYEKVLEFREHYEGRMHCTVRWAIREQTLTVISEYFDNEITVFTDRLLALLEPAITIILAFITVGLLLAVYLPMFTMYGSVA